MKKKILAVLMMLSLVCVISACGSSGDSSQSSGGTSASGNIAKDEWIGLLGGKFGYDSYISEEDIFSDVSSLNAYYDEIQACAEWDILPEESVFEPSDGATLGYVIETCVRAIGVDKLNKSDIGMTVTEDNLVEFFTGYIADIGSTDSDLSLDAGIGSEEAGLILEYAYSYAMNMSLVESVEYTYNDGVYEAGSDELTLSGDGFTATVNNGEAYEAGDVIYVQSSDSLAGYAVVVESVDGNEITYEQAGLEEVYEELQVSGTFTPDVVNASAADGVTISISDSENTIGTAYASYPESAAICTGTMEERSGGEIMATDSGSVSKTVDFGVDEGDLTLSVVLSDFSVTANIDYGLIKGLKTAEATVTFQDEIKVEYKSENYSKTIQLGSVELALGSTPLTVKISVAVNFGIDGEATLVYTSEVSASVGYKSGSGLSKSIDNNDSSLDYNAEVTVTAEPTIKAELRCLSVGIVNVKVTSGLVAVTTVDVDLLGSNPECTDVFVYVPLRWAVNEDSCLMVNISSKLKYSATVWDSDSSPINMNLHWEDGVLVDECTRTEAVETESVDEEGVPYDEYNLFDFDEIVFYVIEVKSQKIYLSEGESSTVGITVVPDGYSAKDFVYSVDDPSVCSVSNGTVTALSPGSTTIEISTPDGLCKVYVAVVVEMEYNDTSGFESL